MEGERARKYGTEKEKKGEAAWRGKRKEFRERRKARQLRRKE